jgi:hypothetical protein
VPYHLASADPAVFAIGLGFVRRTLGLCALCFGVTVALTLLLLTIDRVASKAVAAGREPAGYRPAYDGWCYRESGWSCLQWSVDALLILLVLPLKFVAGWRGGYTRPLLVALAVFQSANLALAACASPRLAPLIFQAFAAFELALVLPPKPVPHTVLHYRGTGCNTNDPRWQVLVWLHTVALDAAPVPVGLVRIVVLHHRSSTSYHNYVLTYSVPLFLKRQ